MERTHRPRCHLLGFTLERETKAPHVLRNGSSFPAQPQFADSYHVALLVTVAEVVHEGRTIVGERIGPFDRSNLIDPERGPLGKQFVQKVDVAVIMGADERLYYLLGMLPGTVLLFLGPFRG